MDLAFDDETQEFRAEVRDFLAANKNTSRPSRTTRPRVSNSIAVGTRCFSTRASR